MKWLHVFPKLGVIRKLVHQTKPASDVSGTDGRWKVLYGTVEIWKRVNPLVSDTKPSKFCFLSCKLELVGVQHYASPTNNNKKINGSPPMILQVIVIEDGVMYYVLLLVKVSKDSIESAIVAISR